MSDPAALDPSWQLTCRLAGYFGAHCIWSLAEGEALVPLLGFMRDDRVRDLTRLEDDEPARAVRHGSSWLEANPDRVRRAVLVYDAELPTEAGVSDAVLVEARDYGQARGFVLAIPYRSGEAATPFRIERPTFVAPELAPAEVEAMSAQIYRGINEHAQAAKVWRAHSSG